MAKPPDPLIGQIVGGRYEVLRLIGKGGTGSIYEVRNVRLGRSFALKTLTGESAANAEAMQRFRREADIVAKIKHPNIVEVIDWDELPDGSPCMVLEYLEGEDLAVRIDRGVMSWASIALIADRMLAALSVTHASGVVHRDLKPHNVFLATDDSGDERIKLLDFGISKISDSNSMLTSNSRLVGTPAYMAPEQAEGRLDDVGPHTDVWAMGVILYEMATGEYAFDGPSVPAILYQICHGTPTPIEELRPDVPREFADLVRDALVRPVKERIADAAVMRVQLRDALRSVAPPPDAAMSSARVATATSPPRRVWPYVVVAGAAVAAAGAVVAATMLQDDWVTPKTKTPDGGVAKAVVVDAAARPTPDAVAPVDAAVAPDAPARKLSWTERVGLAVDGQTSELLACARDRAAPQGDIDVTIAIAKTGRAQSVKLAPDPGDAALAGCLRDVLMRATYPTGQDLTVTIPLTLLR
jgi:serine/threonine-protein kinase